MTNKAKTMLLIGAMLVGMTPSCVMAANVKEPDWKVNITTEVQKGVLNFKGSKCKDPVKVFINYMDNTEGSDKKPKAYEEFWYNKLGKPIGQEKFNKYDIRQSEQIQMEVKHKDKKKVEPEEYKAAANAAIRFFLDCMVHKGSINTLLVPAQSFEGILESMEEQGFAKFEPETDDASTPSGKKPFLLIRTANPDEEDKSQYVQYDR